MRAEEVAKAANTRDRYEAEGWPVPMWARNVCSWAATPEKITAIYEFDDTDTETESAIAALSAVLR
jgi:hypothetical protein